MVERLLNWPWVLGSDYGELVVKCLATDAEGFGGGEFVAVELGEGGDDVAGFGFGQGDCPVIGLHG